MPIFAAILGIKGGIDAATTHPIRAGHAIRQTRITGPRIGFLGDTRGRSRFYFVNDINALAIVFGREIFEKIRLIVGRRRHTLRASGVSHCRIQITFGIFGREFHDTWIIGGTQVILAVG